MIDNTKWNILFNSPPLKSEINSVLSKIKDLKNKGKIIFPHEQDIFKAFELCEFEKLKVVIIGQDPYHGVGQAGGLAFSVSETMPLPPSLKNIFKELSDDIQEPILKNGNLEHWAKQGVLLMNSILTVESNKAGSHRKLGWESITDQIIQAISEQKNNVVFILWGNFAMSKMQLIDQTKHFVLTAAHPSPLSAYRGFFGCKHFSKTNTYLRKYQKKQIKW